MPRLILLGDSTCAIKKPECRPETGWGEAFYPFLKPDWTILNYAQNGYSTTSMLKTGTFSRALLEAKEGDSAIIEFAHNDEKTDWRGTRPFVEYIANLKYMATAFKEKNVDVFFLTPVPRRRFVSGRIVDTHNNYIAAMKVCGYQVGVDVVDITLPLMIDLTLLGEEESKKYYMNFPPNIYPNYPEGSEDDTHLRPEGAVWVSKMVYSTLREYKASFIAL